MFFLDILTRVKVCITNPRRKLYREQHSNLLESDFRPTVCPQPQKGISNLTFKDYIPPPAPMAPEYSHHLSSMIYEPSAKPTSVHAHAIDAMLRHQSRVAMEDSSHPIHSPAQTTIFTSPKDRPAGRHSMATASPSIPNADQQQVPPITESIRLHCVWDKAHAMVDIDLNANGEAFVNTIQAYFQKRGKTLDRDAHSILLKTDKGKPDAEGFPLSLHEADLVADWEVASDWMKDNKKEAPPRLFGIVEVSGG